MCAQQVVSGEEWTFLNKHIWIIKFDVTSTSGAFAVQKTLFCRSHSWRLQNWHTKALADLHTIIPSHHYIIPSCHYSLVRGKLILVFYRKIYRSWRASHIFYLWLILHGVISACHNGSGEKLPVLFRNGKENLCRRTAVEFTITDSENGNSSEFWQGSDKLVSWVIYLNTSDRSNCLCAPVGQVAALLLSVTPRSSRCQHSTSFVHALWRQQKG